MFNSGVYTACEPCKAHPERPPLWQVRAAKIIENQQTHVVYYEDAWLEVAGVPIAYVPYFSAPDPTVTRQSGLLAPTFTRSTYARHRRRRAVFSRSRAQLRSDPDADLFLVAGSVPRRRMAPAARDRTIRRPRHRHRPAERQPFPGLPLRFRRPSLARLAGDEGRVLSQRQMEVGLGHHGDVRSVLSQRLQDQERRPGAVLSAGRRVVGLSARPGRPRLLRSQRLSVREHRPPPPTSASSRSPRPCSTTTRRSRFRPRRPAASAARSRSTSTRPTSRARRRPTSRRWPTRSTRPTSSTMSARPSAPVR